MEFWKNFILFLSDEKLVLPFGQVIFFTFLVSLCFLFGRNKLGLLIAYNFVFYWGFILNHEYFINILGDTSGYFFLYFFCGLVASLLTLIGSFKESR